MNTFKKAEKLGRQAWLASLGAYGSGWKYAVEKLDEAYTKTNTLMSELVSEGEKLEADLQEKLKARVALDTKIDALKDKLGLNDVSDSERLAELDKQLDGLVDVVTAYAEKLAKKKPAKKKATAKKS